MSMEYRPVPNNEVLTLSLKFHLVPHIHVIYLSHLLNTGPDYNQCIHASFLTRSLREPGGPCTKSMEVSEYCMERVNKLCRYYIFPISIYRWNYIVKNWYISLYAGTQFQLQSMRPRLDIKSNVSGCTNPIKLTRRISAVRNSLRLKKKIILWRKKP